MINSLEEFYEALDILLSGISQTCQRCQEDDCKGYLWLLPQEVNELYEREIEILEINKNICFINPFIGKEGEINTEKFKPECPLRKEKRCTIHNIRPLVCRMYPLSFFTERSTIYIVLHLDCLYSKERAKDAVFTDQAIKLFKSLDPQLLIAIKEVYRRVDGISKFPNGQNNYVRLGAV